MRNSRLTKNPPYVLVEGQRLITDTLAAGGQLRTLLFTRRGLLEKLPFQATARTMFVHPRILKKWSDVVTPSGLFGEALQVLQSGVARRLICKDIFKKQGYRLCDRD